MSDKMNADEINKSFKIIQNHLDSLYEKIRITEELNTFCLEYLKNEIETKKEKLQESLKITEDISPLFQIKDSSSILVSFKGGEEVIKDRDGSIIACMIAKKEKLEPQNNIMADAILGNITFVSNTSCYNNSYKNLLSNELGTSFYSIKNSIPDGIKETVYVTLLSPQECNYVSLKPINCEISDVKIYDENKIEHTIRLNSYFDIKKVSSLVFNITAKNFIREFKTGDIKSYDNSGAAYGGIYDRLLNRETIKQIERSQTQMEKKYIMSEFESKCDTWSRINKDINRKNILLAGEA